MVHFASKCPYFRAATTIRGSMHGICIVMIRMYRDDTHKNIMLPIIYLLMGQMLRHMDTHQYSTECNTSPCGIPNYSTSVAMITL